MSRFVLAAVLLIGVVGLALSAKSISSREAVAVDIRSVSGHELRDVILASGNLTFAREIEIRPELTGKVGEIHVEVGQSVRKGDLLLSLDSSDHEAELDKVESSLTIRQIEIRRMDELLSEANRRIEQQKIMHERGFIDEESYKRLGSDTRIMKIDLEIARERFRQQQALVAQARDRLEKTQFKAPMDGLITRIDVDEGETVVAAATNMVGSSLITLADPGSYMARIRVDEADVANVSIGQAVQIYAAATPSEPARGSIASVSLSADRKSINRGLYYQVEVALDEYPRMFPGMSCRAEILVEQSHGELSVPIASVGEEGDEHFVWVAADGKAWKRTVTPGLASDTQQVITAGVTASDVVIVGPARTLGQLKVGTPINVGGSTRGHP